MINCKKFEKGNKHAINDKEQEVGENPKNRFYTKPTDVYDPVLRKTQPDNPEVTSEDPFHSPQMASVVDQMMKKLKKPQVSQSN